METFKKIKRIDTNLFSGSADVFRSDIGAFYYVSSSASVGGPTVSRVAFNEHYDDLTSIYSPSGDQVFHELPAYYVPLSNKLSHIQFNPDLYTTSSQDLLLHSNKIPVRIIGNSAFIQSDEHWKTVLLGGVFGSSSYNPIYTTAVFNDYSYSYTEPYSMMEAKKLSRNIGNASSYTDFRHYEIGYRYKNYLPNYEYKIHNIDFKTIPHAYMLKMIDDNDNPQKLFSSHFLNFVSAIDNSNLDPTDAIAPIISGDLASSLFDVSLHEYPAPHKTSVMVEDITTPGKLLYEDKSEKLRNYLSKQYNPDLILPESRDYVINKSVNLFYNSGFINRWFRSFNSSDVNSDINKFPFYNLIHYPTVSPIEDTGEPALEIGMTTTFTPTLFFAGAMTDSFTTIIKDNNLEDEFLKAIATKRDNLEKLSFIKEEEKQGFLPNFGAAKEINIQNNDQFSTDYMNLLMSIYKSVAQDTETDGLVMGKYTLENVTADNVGAKYRYHKAVKISKAIEHSKNKINNSRLNTVHQLTNNFQDLIKNLHQRTEQVETIAYRIKKNEGDFLQDTRSITNTQNIYFMNSDDLKVDGENMMYYDTQVKYGKDYEYTLYAYVIVSGCEYKYSDLRLSRNIGTLMTMDENSLPVINTIDNEKHCIEFYNPNGLAATSQLLKTETNLLGTEYEPWSGTDPEWSYAWNAWSYAKSLGLTLGEVDPIQFTSVPEFGEFSLITFSPPTTAVLPTPDTEVTDYLNDLAADADTSSSEVNEIQMQLFETWCINTIKAPTSSDSDDVMLVKPFTKNAFATNSQIKSSNKYLADFNFHYMPTVKIIEVPLAYKTVRVMDNPPVAADVTPYQRKDDSQTIGFYINVESFRFPRGVGELKTKNDDGKYPTTMNDQESTKKSIYLESNNIIQDEVLQNNSVSKIKFLEVYRLDRRPTSIKDFNNNLVFTKDLTMKENPKYKHTNCFYEEKVQTNKKYYYLFRFLNEQRCTGYLAPIQVAELIDDGGYKYSNFDVIFESELFEESKQQHSIPFKKVMEIVPSAHHVMISDKDIDYTSPAADAMSQISEQIGNAEDLIWGKTFKFRLTSKKTGRKIDFNIKYNLRDM